MTLGPSVSEIKHCIVQGFSSFKHLKHVHTRLVRFGLHQDNYLVNMLLKSIFTFSNQSYARLVFNQTHQPNVFLWNTMIQGFVSNNCFEEALQLFVSMRKQSFFPNNFTLPFVLKACSRLSDFKLGLEVHCLVVKAGFDSDVFVKTGMVCLYARCGYLGDAHKVFEAIVHKNVVCWTAIISGYMGIGKFKEAIDMFRDLLGMNLRPDSYTLVRVLSACTQLGDVNTGVWIHRYVADIGMEGNVFVGTSLVDMYAKSGNMEAARRVFDGMPEKDIVSWSAMIQGYASNGLPKEALDRSSSETEQR